MVGESVIEGDARVVSATGGTGRSDHLEFIRQAGRTTRKAIAEHTGLSRSVVAQAVAELIAQGLVVERRLPPHPGLGAPGAVAGSRRGRPTSVLELAPRPGVVVANDIGHRHLTVAVTDLHARVLAERRIHLPVDDGAVPTFRALHRLIGQTLRQAGATPAEVRAFGVSFPFPVLKNGGIVQAPGSLAGWQGVDSAAARPAGMTGPMVVDNDANFGAWGELIHGRSARPADPLDNLFYVKLSDGIGAGLVVDGMLLSGARGMGGEMGHIPVDPDGPLCRCGQRGCLETIMTGSATDPFAAGKRIGRAIAQASAFIDAEVVVLGGQFGAPGGPLVDGVREAFSTTLPAVQVRPAALGARSEVVGIIDRALTAAWASGDLGLATPPEPIIHSSYRRTNSAAVLDDAFDAERLVMKE